MRWGDALDNEIDELVFEHSFGMEVCNQERDIVALPIKR